MFPPVVHDAKRVSVVTTTTTKKAIVHDSKKAVVCYDQNSKIETAGPNSVILRHV